MRIEDGDDLGAISVSSLDKEGKRVPSDEIALIPVTENLEGKVVSKPREFINIDGNVDGLCFDLVIE